MKKIHLWLSIPSGIVITLICLTGAVMVFQQEILELFHRERYYVARVEAAPLSLDTLVAQVNRKLESSATINSVQLFADPYRTIQASLSSGRKNYVYINPYTAEITGYYNSREGFFHLMVGFHRWLMFPDRMVGKMIVGVSTIILLFILLSGVFRWWRSKSFTIKWKGGFLRKVLDLHRVLGIYGAILLIVCSLSGLMWSFNWYRLEISSLFQTEKVEARQVAVLEQPDAWQTTYEHAVRVINNYQYIRVNKGGHVDVLPPGTVNERAVNKYQYVSDNGAFNFLEKYGEKRDRNFILGWAYVIHVGSWGGMLTKWLTFFAALFGASLPVTGYILYFRRMLRRKR